MARIIQPNSFSLIFLFYQFARKVNMGMIYFLVMLHGANVFARGIIPWMLVFWIFLSAIVISKFRALTLSN
jgi:hypothetical protein